MFMTIWHLLYTKILNCYPTVYCFAESTIKFRVYKTKGISQKVFPIPFSFQDLLSFHYKLQ